LATREILLMGLSPSIQGLRWQTEQRLRIGRQANLEIEINEPSLAQQHAEVRLTPQGWVVRDMESGAGTLLNGVPVGKLSRKLQREDVLQCGKHSFKVDQLTWEPPAAPSSWPQDIKTSGPLVCVKAFSQLSWEQGLRELTLEDAPLPHAKQFLTLLRAGYHLSHIDSVNELLQTLLDDTVAALGAQRGAILLANGTTGQLALKSFAGAKSAASNRVCSMTLAQRCFSKGESLLCLDRAAEENSSASVILGEMTSIICALLRSPRRRLGVLHLDRGPRQAPFSQEDFKLADAIAATVSVGIESAVGVEKQRTQFLQEVLDMAYAALAVRDLATAQHCQRVCTAALALAETLRLSTPERHQLQLGALLHDLGMIGVRDGPLLNGSETGTPDADQEKQLREHPLHGVAIAEKVSAFAPALAIIRSHHECWDGKGYPDGLQGDQIPRLARIVAVADALDNLGADQLGAQAFDRERVLSFFKAEAGRRFDPEIVAALGRTDLCLQGPLTVTSPATSTFSS
jgi:HD-GYP domain-containing protein (c-di-GMP phosphodiesterase class II)